MKWQRQMWGLMVVTQRCTTQNPIYKNGGGKYLDISGAGNDEHLEALDI